MMKESAATILAVLGWRRNHQSMVCLLGSDVTQDLFS